MRLLNILMLCTVLIVTGCAKNEIREKSSSLEDTVTQYEVSIRWGHYRDALSFHVNELGVQPIVELDLLDEIRVSGVDVLDRFIDSDTGEALITFEIEYYNEAVGAIKKVRLQHRWWYNEDVKRWFNKSEFPIDLSPK